MYARCSSLEGARLIRAFSEQAAHHPEPTLVPVDDFPLSFRGVEKIEIVEADFNEEFLRGFLARIEWAALRKSAAELGNTDLPETSPDLADASSISVELLRKMHHVLLEIQVQDGSMVCPSCEHVFVIKEGIPNMLLAEHEVRR